MNKEQMITCPMTGGDACVEAETSQGVKTYFSFSNGFQSNTLMIENSEFLTEQMELLPELYKDLAWKDPNTNLVWIPSLVNIPKKGMVFANGSSKNDWKWSSVKAVEVKEEEKTKYPIPNTKNQYYSYRMDMSTLKSFPERDYIEALDYISFFE
jgi:hypothetical protein